MIRIEELAVRSFRCQALERSCAFLYQHRPRLAAVRGAEQTAGVGLPVESGHPGGLRVEKPTAILTVRKRARGDIAPGLSTVGGAEEQILTFHAIRPGPTIGGIDHMDFR